MARLNIQERIFIVETTTVTRSITAIWSKVNTKFGHKVTRNIITDNVKKWKQFGSVQDCHKGNSSRKKSARSPENRDKGNSLIHNNSKNVRQENSICFWCPKIFCSFYSEEVPLFETLQASNFTRIEGGRRCQRDLRFATELKR